MCAFSDGVTKSGLFTAVSCIWEKMKVDQEVDIFHAVKHLRYHRPQIVKNQVSAERVKAQQGVLFGEAPQEQPPAVFCSVSTAARLVPVVGCSTQDLHGYKIYIWIYIWVYIIQDLHLDLHVHVRSIFGSTCI